MSMAWDKQILADEVAGADIIIAGSSWMRRQLGSRDNRWDHVRQ